MKRNSLALRLILLAGFSISIALIIIAFALNSLFHAFFEDRIFSELDQHLKQLTANLSLDENGEIVISPLVDQLFRQPFSGHYWQVFETDGQALASRSLWGISYDFPSVEAPGITVQQETDSSQGVPLLILGWTVFIGEADAQRAITLSVASNETEVDLATTAFRSAFLQWLSLIFVGLFAASWVQVRIGLAPLEALRGNVERVRSGTLKRLEGELPREVQPLADEVNELLELHDKSLESARARASTLAHGLKTPLTVMLTLTQDLRGKGMDAAAEEVETQVESMRHFIERELARVRTHMPSPAGCRALPVVEKMVSTLQKFPRGEEITWQVDLTDNLILPINEHDLAELLGNILDNARIWAKSRVLVVGQQKNGVVSICVEDDGPGVPKDKLQSILERGQRLEPDVKGTGLGLAISSDIATENGAATDVTHSSLGGLSVCFTWDDTNSPV